MQQLFVDLRGYPPSEREKMYGRLDGFAFICNICLDAPGLYQVFCNSKEDIKVLLNIPENLITSFRPQ